MIDIINVIKVINGYVVSVANQDPDTIDKPRTFVVEEKSVQEDEAKAIGEAVLKLMEQPK